VIESPTGSEPALFAEGCHVRYGGAAAVADVGLTVDPGSCVGVIGPNGAGKSSLLNAIAGLVPLTEGRVLLRGQDVTNASAERRVRLGLALVAEGRTALATLTVAENLRLGMYPLGGRRRRSEQRELYRYVFEMFPPLAERGGQRAGSLSGGEAQMLAIARALMSRARILLLDEPTLGLGPHVARAVIDALRSLKEDGLTIVIVEQKVPLLETLCDRLVVLRQGRVAREGPTGQIAGSDLQELYLVQQ
jgi:branched-chain amino acid transport system ATP-binding protein